MRFRVPRFETAPAIDGVWEKAPWTDVRPETLGNFMGERPEHFPEVRFRIAYDADALYVIFCVGDRYVRAVQRQPHSAVCTDSCVEFFFTPGPDIAVGYFNIEVNCGGTIYFDWHPTGRPAVAIAEADLDGIGLAHSMPRIVEPEIADPVTWTVEYRLPLALLRKYAQIVEPAAGVTWRANFYKCADYTSHPHWLTWAFVDLPQPCFHAPPHFGTIAFA